MTTTDTPRTIKVRDAGPIRSLDIPLPEGGGVVVLCGPNGSGKTTAINAVACALGGNEAVGKRDGAIAGSVELDRIKLTLGKQVRATGESDLVALSLQGGELLRIFVDPGIKAPEAADAARIKAALGLMRITATPDDFVQAVGGPEAMADIASEADLQTTDPVDMAGRVKRAAELQARKHETEGERLSGEIDRLTKDNVGVDLAAPHDDHALTAAHEAAVGARDRLEAQRTERDGVVERAAAARAQLAQAEQAGGMSLADADAAVKLRRTELAEARGVVERVAAELQQARQRADAADHAVLQAEQLAASAKGREAALAGFRQAVAAAEGVQPIAAEEVLRAQAAVEGARAARDRGRETRAAIARLAEIETLRSRRDRAGEVAEHFRKAASAAEGVLSRLFASKGAAGLQVRDGRLITEVPGRGEVYFAELSHGQRYRHAIGLGSAGCGPGGLIPLDQVGWEGLDPSNQLDVLEEARARGVTIITAQAADGELRVEEFEPSGGEATA